MFPEDVTRYLAGAGRKEFVQVECDPLLTQPGDRIAVYEAEMGRGIVAVADVHTRPRSESGAVPAAWAVLRELAHPVARSDLVEAGLGSVLRRAAQQVCALNEEAQSALASVLVPWPPFTTNGEPLPEANPAIHWVPGGGEDEVWLSEKEMQYALAADREALRSLGIDSRPRIEDRYDGGRYRFDIADDRVVIECKLFAQMGDLDQLRKYLLARGEDGGGHQGHLVTAFGYMRDVAAEIEELADEARAEGSRPQISLWVCLKRPGGGVALRPHDRDLPPERNFRAEVASLIQGFAAASMAVMRHASDIAADAGLSDEELALAEAEAADDEEPWGAEAESAGIAPEVAYRSCRLACSRAYDELAGMAIEAGVPEDRLDAAEDAADRHLRMEENSTPDSLATSLRYIENMLIGLFEFGSLCGLEYGRMFHLRDPESVPDDLGEAEMGFIAARGYWDVAADALIRLGMAAGLSEDEVAAATAGTIFGAGDSDPPVG